MKDLFIVTKFTMKDMLQRKSFIITTIIFLIMIVVGFNIPNFMKMLNKDSDVNKIFSMFFSFCNKTTVIDIKNSPYNPDCLNSVNNPLIVRLLAQVGTFQIIPGLPWLHRSFVSPPL